METNFKTNKLSGSILLPGNKNQDAGMLIVLFLLRILDSDWRESKAHRFGMLLQIRQIRLLRRMSNAQGTYNFCFPPPHIDLAISQKQQVIGTHKGWIKTHTQVFF